MLCVICLRNNADIKVVCGNCSELPLPNCNKKVEDSVAKRLAYLPIERQMKIVRLTHKRFQSLLEYNLSREFTLNNVLNEYLDMENRNKWEDGKDDLEMSVSDRPYHGMKYNQYMPPTKE